MQTPDPASNVHRTGPQPTTPRPPDPPRYDPRLVAVALNAFAAVVRWLDHHMSGWLM
jgi:hypothetical protein